MRIQLKFHKATEFDGNAKATVHKSGKLGFSESAMKLLKLETNKYMRIATNEEDESDSSLYVIVQPKEDEYTFKVAKSGDYFYGQTKPLFDNLNVEYEKQKVIYNIVPFDEYDGIQVYKFKRRDLERKKEEA